MQLSTCSVFTSPFRPISPPRRGRVRPWIAFKSFMGAMRDAEDTASGTRFVMALEGQHTQRLLERFRRDPAGARILAERRSIRSALSNREGLRNMPAGSLGRAYLAFSELEEISLEGLVAGTSGPTREVLALTPEEAFLSDRITDQHDLWHVVTGYSRDALGELALIGFGYEQLGTRAYGLLVGLGMLFGDRRAPGTRKLLRTARARGRRASWLLVEDWEALLERPLDEVRAQLRVGPPPKYTRYFMVDRRLVPETL